MRPKEVGDAVCPQLAASDRLALRSRERSAQPGLLAHTREAGSLR